VSKRMTRYPSSKAVSRSAWHSNRPVPCPWKRLGQQPLHLARTVVAVAVGDPTTDLTFAHRKEHLALRWPIGLRKGLQLGIQRLVAAHSVDETREIGVASMEPIPVLANQAAEDLVVAVRGRNHDLVSHPQKMPHRVQEVT
jgi:hypothetical protein